MGQTEVAAEYTRKAYELRDRVSDRERLWTLFLYDRQVTGTCKGSCRPSNRGCKRIRAITYPMVFWRAGGPLARANMKGEFERPKRPFG